jgi:hypothetical protein
MSQPVGPANTRISTNYAPKNFRSLVHVTGFLSTESSTKILSKACGSTFVLGLHDLSCPLGFTPHVENAPLETVLLFHPIPCYHLKPTTTVWTQKFTIFVNLGLSAFWDSYKYKNMDKITQILKNVARCKCFEAGVHIKNPIKNSYQDGLGRTTQTLDHVVVVHILFWDKRKSQINEYSDECKYWN